jgi:hypothetical protein
LRLGGICVWSRRGNARIAASNVPLLQGGQ